MLETRRRLLSSQVLARFTDILTTNNDHDENIDESITKSERFKRRRRTGICNFRRMNVSNCFERRGGGFGQPVYVPLRYQFWTQKSGQKITKMEGKNPGFSLL